MMLLNFAPRFTATVFAAEFGSRDEICGWRAVQTFHAETSAWLDKLVEQYLGPDADGWYEIDVKVTDSQPEKIVANWGPAMPRRWEVIPGTNERDEDLPF